MEVGEEALHQLEVVVETGGQEQAGGAGVRGDGRLVALGFAGDVFEGAGGGGAYGDDASSLLNGVVDGVGGGLRERVGFGVEADVFGAVYADGLEGAQAYVKG